jgi:NADH-quinone oxidoreductase subunit E
VNHLPLDPALVEGRHPEHPPEEIPGIEETGCPDDLREQIEELMSRYPDRHSASIPALWAVQRRYGWCTPEGMRQAAAVMRVTPAYLESVASFYDLLHTSPVGRHRVLVCTNISCWMRGGDELLDSFCEAAGCDVIQAGHHGGSSSEDGELFVTGFECLGACDLAPMASIDERYFGPLTGDDANTAVQQLLAGGEVLPDKALEKRGAAGGPETEPDPRVAKAEGGDA